MIRWILFFVVLLSVVLYVFGGYLHAQRRVRKGLRPLAYHRCLVSRRSYAPAREENQWPSQGPCHYPPQQSGYQQAYPMNDMPLPAYDPNSPPVYPGPPEGGSKVDPSQSRPPTHRAPADHPAPAYTPPQGPPPNKSS